MLGALAVLGVGYVLGAKAGRRRYDQIAGTYRAVSGHPAAKALIDTGRRKLANRMSPDPSITEITVIEAREVSATDVASDERPTS